MELAVTVHRTMGRGLQAFALLFALVLGVVAVSIPHWIARIWAVICALIVLGLIFFRETRVDTGKRVVTEITLLLGFIPFGWHERAFTDFQAVRSFCHISGEASDTWYVALVPQRGNEIWVRQYATGVGEACLAARDFARELSVTVGLELRED